MNIFVLHEDPRIAAQMACDQHVVKMPTETAQMLSIVWQDQPVRPHLVYAPTKLHVKHPCTLWIGASTGNYAWAVEHGIALCEEHGYRYPDNPVHAAWAVIDALRQPPASVPSGPRSAFARVVPPDCLRPDAIDAYRAAYTFHKSKFARWLHRRSPPYWWRPPSQFY